MDRKLKIRIAEEAEYLCKLCGRYSPQGVGSPHHIIKQSEEKLLMDARKNIIWLCPICHRKTEDVPGFNRKLKKELQSYYNNIFIQGKHYSIKEIAEMIGIPAKDIEKAMQKGRLKFEFVGDIPKSSGEATIRFLMGEGKSYE